MTRGTSLAAKWDAYVSRPFPLLVRLSMNRIFHGSNAGEEELNISMGLLLALLAIPGGFASLLLFDKYGSFLQWLRGQTKFDPLAAAMPDEYFFIVLSMVISACSLGSPISVLVFVTAVFSGGFRIPTSI